MAGKARNFSRMAAAVAATCILGVGVVVPASASEDSTLSELVLDGISTSAVAQAQPASSAPTVVPEEPGQTLSDATADTDAGTGADTPNEGETSSGDASVEADSAGDADSGSSGADGGVDDGINDGADGAADGGDGSLDGGAGTGDDDADGDSDGEEPPATEEPVDPPLTHPELPTEPVAPQPEGPGPEIVPEEPGKVEHPHSSRSDQSGEPTLNTSISPDSENVDGAADDGAVKAKSEALAATGANELLIVIGIGALLVIGGLVLVVLRLRKRDN